MASLEGEHRGRGSAAPPVDRLVLVPHGAERVGPLGDEFRELRLSAVDVLELVDEQMANLGTDTGEHVRRASKQRHGEPDEVCEVDRPRFREGLVVRLPHLPGRGNDAPPRGKCGLLDGDPIPLRPLDEPPELRRRKLLLVDVQILQDPLQHVVLIPGVVDDEAPGEADTIPVASQEDRAEGVEGSQPGDIRSPRTPAERPGRHVPRGRFPAGDERLRHPVPHLPRRPVREGDPEDAPRGHAVPKQADNAGHDRPRLPRSRPRHQEERPPVVEDRTALVGIERGEDRVGKHHGNGSSPFSTERCRVPHRGTAWKAGSDRRRKRCPLPCGMRRPA